MLQRGAVDLELSRRKQIGMLINLAAQCRMQWKRQREVGGLWMNIDEDLRALQSMHRLQTGY